MVQQCLLLYLGNGNRLGLILGLSLGLGIAALSIIIGGIAYYSKVVKPKCKVTTNGTTITTEILMAPVATSTNNNTTVSALVA
jgi:hypothetical protein